MFDQKITATWKVFTNDGDIRRFEHPYETTIAALRSTVATVLEREQSSFKISWTDEEGDNITVGTSEELSLAIRHQADGAGPIRIRVQFAPPGPAKPAMTSVHPKRAIVARAMAKRSAAPKAVAAPGPKRAMIRAAKTETHKAHMRGGDNSNSKIRILAQHSEVARIIALNYKLAHPKHAAMAPKRKDGCARPKFTFARSSKATRHSAEGIRERPRERWAMRACDARPEHVPGAAMAKSARICNQIGIRKAALKHGSRALEMFAANVFEQLRALDSMGFPNHQRNARLLVRFDGDVNLVAEHLSRMRSGRIRSP